MCTLNFISDNRNYELWLETLQGRNINHTQSNHGNMMREINKQLKSLDNLLISL